MTAPLTIAIDGPSGSGKSSVSRAVAAPARRRLPRHRRHVPRAHLVVPRARPRPHRRGCRGAAARDLPLEIGTDPDAPTVRGRHRRHRGHPHDGRAAPRCRRSRRTSRCAVLQQPQRDLMAGSPSRPGEWWPRAATSPPSWRRTRACGCCSRHPRRRGCAARRPSCTEAPTPTPSRRLATRWCAATATTRPCRRSPRRPRGVVLVDTSDLDFEQSVEAVLDVVAAETARVMPGTERRPGRLGWALSAACSRVLYRPAAGRSNVPRRGRWCSRRTTPATSTARSCWPWRRGRATSSCWRRCSRPRRGSCGGAGRSPSSSAGATGGAGAGPGGARPRRGHRHLPGGRAGRGPRRRRQGRGLARAAVRGAGGARRPASGPGAPVTSRPRGPALRSPARRRLRRAGRLDLPDGVPGGPARPGDRADPDRARGARARGGGAARHPAARRRAPDLVD